MAEVKRVYWDTCVWLALINQDSADRVQRCQNVLDMAKRREVEVWTSALTLAEVFKKKCEDTNAALPNNRDAEFEQYIQQEHLVLAQLDYDVGVQARRLLRSLPSLKKPPDGIHLATAVLYNLDELHTFDADNLLSLNGTVRRADGNDLTICEPPLPAQGTLPLAAATPSMVAAEAAPVVGLTGATLVPALTARAPAPAQQATQVEMGLNPVPQQGRNGSAKDQA